MPLIELETFIHAAPGICFDLSLDIDLHLKSMRETRERVVGGKAKGLLNLGETIRWKAKHFGIYFTMTVQITELMKPFIFVDEMINGPFKSLKHTHLFELTPNGTIMTDQFNFQAPFGFFGKIAENLFLVRYMRNLLIKRNETIKHTAENQQFSRC